MKRVSNLAATLLVALMFLLLALTISSAAANPIVPSMIEVTSPQNNKIYPSSDIELTFIVMPDYNLTVATYSLDGQAAKPANGSTHLSDLPSGFHKITIYGTYTFTDRWTNSTYHYENTILQTVHFSINYNPNQITFAATVSALLVVVCTVTFIGRRRLVRRLKGEKTGVFWLGLVCLVFFAFVLFGPVAWQMLADYLFPKPYYPRGMVLSPFPYLLLGVFFMGVGVVMMAFGSRQSKRLVGQQESKEPQREESTL